MYVYMHVCIFVCVYVCIYVCNYARMHVCKYVCIIIVCLFLSTREKVAKFLQSNPVQILLCVIVLLDAGIVIAQILLDLNSVKGDDRYKHTIIPISKYIHRSYVGKDQIISS